MTDLPDNHHDGSRVSFYCGLAGIVLGFVTHALGAIAAVPALVFSSAAVTFGIVARSEEGTGNGPEDPRPTLASVGLTRA